MKKRYYRWAYQVDAIVHNKNKNNAKLQQNRLIASVCINKCTNFKRKYKKEILGTKKGNKKKLLLKNYQRITACIHP